MSRDQSLVVRWLPWIFLAGFGLVPGPSRAGEPFALQGGERIVFFGDSITQAGHYVTDVEVFLLTRFPDRSFTVINHGISSETISGTSEPDHQPRRPYAHDRFTRDVAAWKPDVVVACFGMNDGNYHPFDEARFAKFQAGVRRLIDRTRNEAHARLVILSPPPFDPYRRQVGDPLAKDFGYKFPAVDYDRTLDRYSQWLRTLRDEGIEVVDLHTAMNTHLERRRTGDVSYYLAGDAVHPNETGHWLMAQSLLLDWQAPSTCAELKIDARTLRTEAGDVRDLTHDQEGLALTWKSPLPMPIPDTWDRRSLEIEKVADRLNRYRLAVTGLPEGRYRLLARLAGEPDDVQVAVVSQEDLSRGLDLSTNAVFPTVRLARTVYDLVRKRNQSDYAAWRREIARDPATAHPVLEPDTRPETTEIHRLCQPKDLRIRIIPVEKE